MVGSVLVATPDSVFRLRLTLRSIPPCTWHAQPCYPTLLLACQAGPSLIGAILMGCLDGLHHVIVCATSSRLEHHIYGL